MDFYPRMTSKVFNLLIACKYGDVTRATIRPSDKGLALRLLWDGWIQIIDIDTELSATHKRPSDLALTGNGHAWLKRVLETRLAAQQ